MSDAVTLLFDVCEQKNTISAASPSFFSVIGRSYDEDLISRVVAFS